MENGFRENRSSNLRDDLGKDENDDRKQKTPAGPETAISGEKNLMPHGSTLLRLGL
jgi:hypothetical protein